MVIIYLHQYFTTPEMSGGTRSYEMARRMVRAGHEVHVITSRTDGGLKGNGWYREDIEGINVHWLPVRYDNSMGYGRRILAFSDFARKAGRYAAQIEADVVFATSTPLTIAIPGVKVSKALGIPLVFEVRDLWPELPIAMGALNFPFAKTLARGLEQWAYRHSAKVVGLSPGMCDGVAATGYPRCNIACIPNSSDVELFSVKNEAGKSFRSARPWLEDRKLVVYAGTFGRINGVAALAEIAAEMKDIDKEVRFLVVGRGAEYELVEKRATELGVLDLNFFMEPAIPKAEIPALFNAATVCTSLFIPLEPMWNNSANKFFDALAAGRPVVINYGGWQKKLIEDNNVGISLPYADSKQAAVDLHRLLSDDERLREAGENAFRLATEEFSRDRLAGQLMSVLDEVVGGGNV